MSLLTTGLFQMSLLTVLLFQMLILPMENIAFRAALISSGLSVAGSRPHPPAPDRSGISFWNKRVSPAPLYREPVRYYGRLSIPPEIPIYNPGACVPTWCPWLMKTCGSLMVIQFFTRSDNFSTTTLAYSANQSELSGFNQPPRQVSS